MKDYLEWLDARHEEVGARPRALSADLRQDESDLMKAKANIYRICKTVWLSLSAHMPQRGEGAYEQQLSSFRQSWSAALAAARQRDDPKAVAVEQLKLEALEEICARYRAAREART